MTRFYKLLLLDFDGTLADSQPIIVSTMQATFAHFQVESPSPEQIRSVIGLGLEEGFRTLFPELQGTEAVQSWVEVYRELYLVADHATQLYPGALAALQYLWQAQFKMVIVSNKNIRALNPALERLGIRSYLHHVVGETQGQPLKPDPALFHDWILPLFPEVNAPEVLVVGDSHIDLHFARQIGADGCWVSYGYGDPGLCEALDPTYRIEHPAQLKDLI